MGSCASSYFQTTAGNRFIASRSSSTAKVINSADGGLQEFRQPISAGRVVSGHPNTFLCSSEAMFVGRHVPHVPADEELQPGQIYFLLPIAKSNRSLSLREMCLLAIAASAALEKEKGSESETRKVKGRGTASFRGKSNVKVGAMASFRRKSDVNVEADHRARFQLALKQLQ